MEDDPMMASIRDGLVESMFQRWYAGHAKKAGLAPNPDDPEHYYDYRGLWRAMQQDPQRYAPQRDPSDGNRWHLSSEFKLEGHPRMILNGVNTKTGERAR